MYKAKRLQRHTKIRKKVTGTSDRLRVAIFRSTQHIYAQVIDDIQNKTVVAESDLKVKSGNKMERAMLVGENLAKKALGMKITKVVFDRGGFLYHGRIKAVAEGLRKGGLQF